MVCSAVGHARRVGGVDDGDTARRGGGPTSTLSHADA